MITIRTMELKDESALKRYDTGYKNAYELLPGARNNTYEQLIASVRGLTPFLLIIKLDAESQDSYAYRAIRTDEYGPFMSACHYVLKEMSSLQLLSLSYHPQSASLDNGMKLCALVATRMPFLEIEDLGLKLQAKIEGTLERRVNDIQRVSSGIVLSDDEDEGAIIPSQEDVVSSSIASQEKEIPQTETAEEVDTTAVEDKATVAFNEPDSLVSETIQQEVAVEASGRNSERTAETIVNEDEQPSLDLNLHTLFADDLLSSSIAHMADVALEEDPIDELISSFGNFSHYQNKTANDDKKPSAEEDTTASTSQDISPAFEFDDFSFDDVLAETNLPAKHKGIEEPTNIVDAQDAQDELEVVPVEVPSEVSLEEMVPNKDEAMPAIAPSKEYTSKEEIVPLQDDELIYALKHDTKKKQDLPLLNRDEEYMPTYDIRKLTEQTPIYQIDDIDANVTTTCSRQTFDQAFRQAIRYFMENEATNMEKAISSTDPVVYEKFMKDVQTYITRYLDSFPTEDIAALCTRISHAMFNYYVLTSAIQDKNISDIRVLSYDNINVKVHGKHFKASGLSFIDEADYERFIQALMIRNHLSVSWPIIPFTDKDFDPDNILRFNLCLPAINSVDAPYLHIRKVPKEKTTLETLIDAKMLDEKLAMYLLDKVATSKGIVFAGPSASGKTTLMNALIDYIPKEKSILCIQESEELFSKIHPNAYFQHIVKDAAGRPLIGLSELGQNGLLCDSEYFIIGECKGAEVRDLLRASNTGHRCWCSVHSQSSTETISRLADYVKYGADYSLKEATRMLKDLEVIVYIRDFKIQEISEIAGYDDDTEQIVYRAIYRRDLL